MISRFLPKDFDSSRAVAILAGRGIYPMLVSENLKKLNIPSKLIAFEGEASTELIDSFSKDDRVIINIGKLGSLLKSLKKLDVGYALMAGQITPKRLFKGLTPDLKATMLLARLKKRNAETIFGAIAQEIELIGVRMLDARAFLDDQLADEGIMVGKAKIDREYLDHAIDIAKNVAHLDIGQGIVARKGTILAVEAFEGTDAMLKRAGEFEASEAFFIKTVKANQDYRFDVPVFGLKTVDVMAKAGILIAGLEAGKTIILEKAKVLSEANKKDYPLRVFCKCKGWKCDLRSDAQSRLYELVGRFLNGKSLLSCAI